MGNAADGAVEGEEAAVNYGDAAILDVDENSSVTNTRFFVDEDLYSVDDACRKRTELYCDRFHRPFSSRNYDVGYLNMIVTANMHTAA